MKLIPVQLQFSLARSILSVLVYVCDRYWQRLIGEEEGGVIQSHKKLRHYYSSSALSIKNVCYKTIIQLMHKPSCHAISMGKKIHWGPSIVLLPIILLHKLQVALKSLWSFCDYEATSNINNEPKEQAHHYKTYLEQSILYVLKYKIK